MRIRKHYSKVLGTASFQQQRSSPPRATVVELSEAARMIHQGYACQVNRSPWDVFPYPPLGQASVKEKEQVMGDYDNQIKEREKEEEAAVMCSIKSRSRSGSSNIPAGLIELIVSEDEPADNIDYESDEEYILERTPKKKKKIVNSAPRGKTTTTTIIRAAAVKEESKHILIESSSTATATYTCKKTDGKQWRCKEIVDKPNSLCHHHHDQLLSYRCTSNTNRKAKLAATERKTSASSRKRPRQKRPRTSTVTSAGLESMYYYSAFGPWRGKQRGSEPAAMVAAVKEDSAEEQLERYVSSRDDDDNDDNEDSFEEGNGEKSSRKKKWPVKARSLNLL